MEQKIIFAVESWFDIYCEANDLCFDDVDTYIREMDAMAHWSNNKMVDDCQDFIGADDEYRDLIEDVLADLAAGASYSDWKY